MGSLLQDVRYAVRMLHKSPGIALFALITLAFGIGANTAIFTVVNAVLLRSMPYPDSDRLVLIWGSDPKEGRDRGQVSFTDIDDVRRQANVFEEVANFADWTPTLAGAGEPERLYATQVGDGFFDVLGVHPALGREFLPEEQQEGKDRVVILSHALWQRRFGGDPAIVGQAITLSTVPHLVVGVMPADARPLPTTLVQGGELYRPIAEAHDDQARAERHLRALARLKPGATLQQAQREVTVVARRLSQQYPATDAGLGFRVVSLRDDTVGDVRPTLLVLSGAVLLVLLIGAVNVANLLLVRSSIRQKELAIRAALGAGPLRLARQAIVESLLLAAAGGGAGVVLAYWATELFGGMAGAVNPQLSAVAPDARVLAFTIVLSAVTGVLFGLGPAMHAAKAAPLIALKQGGTTSDVQGGHARLRNTLVVLEVGVALLLLICAGLLIRSFQRLQSVDAGFDPDHRLVMNVWLPWAKYSQPEKQIPFYRALLERVRALPGVEAAAIVHNPPLLNFDGRSYEVEGRSYAPGQTPEAQAYFISADYLRAMGATLVSGRSFTEQDQESAPLVVMVSESLARAQWPGEDAVGKRIRFRSGPKVDGQYPLRTVVGIVRDVRHDGLNKPAPPGLYLPYLQFSVPWQTLVVRTSGEPLALAPAVRQQVLAIDPDQAVFGVGSYDSFLADSILARRLAMLLVRLFGAVALFLAALGIYGVISFSVVQRRHEIAVRMALGAHPHRVRVMVLRQALGLAALGIVLGAVASFGAAGVLKSLLFQVSSTDLPTYCTVTGLLASTALIAGYLPARRASQVDPMSALRNE